MNFIWINYRSLSIGANVGPATADNSIWAILLLGVKAAPKAFICSGRKKKPREQAGLFRAKPEHLRRDHAHGLAVRGSLVGEFDLARDLGEQRVVLAHADVAAGVDGGAALAHDNAAGGDQFTAIGFHAEAFGMRIAAVSRAAASFFVCHVVLLGNQAEIASILISV